MVATQNTRKPVTELTVEDFHAFPIWEFATDEEGVEGQDETWVRPVLRNQIPIGVYSHLVAAEFSTAGGVQLQGFMTVTTADGIEITPGAVVGEGFYHVLPGMSEERAQEEDLTWAIQSRKEVVEALEGAAADVFPMVYRLHVAILGEETLRSGVVE